MERVITQPNKYVSNNSKVFGIVNAVEVSGFKQVAALADLYKIADCILQKDNEGDGSDAVGQKWYVQATKCEYQLINWANRKTAAGWQKVSYGNADDLTALTNRVSTVESKASTNASNITAVTTTANTNASAIKTINSTLASGVVSAVVAGDTANVIKVTKGGTTSSLTINNVGYASHAGTVNGHAVEADVPSNAKFTDTTYTQGTNITIDDNNKISCTYSYSLPKASTTTLGGVKLGGGINVTSDGVISVPSASIATNTQKGAVVSGNYHTAAATQGGEKVSPKAVSTAAALNNVTTTDGRYYMVESDLNGIQFVNVPWSDTDTTYTATNGLTLTETAFGLSDTTQGLINNAIQSDSLSNIAKLNFTPSTKVLNVTNSAGTTTYVRMTGYRWVVASYGASATVTQAEYNELLEHMQQNQQIFIHTDGYTYSCTSQEYYTPTGTTKNTLIFDIINTRLVKYRISIDGDTLAVTSSSIVIAKKSDIPSLNGYATTESVTNQITKATGDLESEITAAANAAAAAQTTANAAVAKTSAYYFKAASQSGNKLTLTKGDNTTFTYTPTFDTPEQVYTLEGFDILDAASTVYTQGQIAELKNAILAGKIIKLADIGDTDSSATQVLAINAFASDTSVEFAYTTGVGNNQVLVIVTIDLTKSSISTKTITSLNENDVTAISTDVINQLS